MISTEVAIEVNVVDLNLFGELIVLGDSCLFIIGLSIGRIALLHALDCLIELILKDLDRTEWIS